MKKLVEKVENAPESCGVYAFLKNGKPIYIGKAKNLKERLKAYINFLDTRETEKRDNKRESKASWSTRTSYS
jgi:excinuclease ABC subunit C